MRLVTYNFLSGGSARRSGHWALLRERLAPDVVFGQECPPPAAGYGSGLWRAPPGRRWGTAVLVTCGRLRPIPVRGFGGWAVGGELEFPGVRPARPLRVFSLHCPAGDHGYVRTLNRILDRLARLGEGADLVVGGDLNVVCGYRAPDEPVRMSGGERLLLDRLTGELGLVPCWQAMHPGEPLAQTLRWTGDRAMPYHCDGVFVPGAWRRRLESAEVVRGPEWERLSDHLPVVVQVAPARVRKWKVGGLDPWPGAVTAPARRCPGGHRAASR